MTPPQDDRAPRASLVALNYDGRQLLDLVLPSLLAQDVEDLEVVVVDNGSSDGSVAHLAEHWPQVRVVALPQNVGVTAALNAMVLAARGEYVALLNNDVELAPGWFSALVASLEAHPEAGAASGKLLNYYRRDEIDGAGDLFDWAGTATRRGHGERDAGQYEVPRAIFGACAGAAVYRRSAFARVGLFDERFFAFFEDADWNLRAWMAGLTIRYEPAAVGYHMGSATLGQGLTDFTRYHLIRNGIWVLAKDYPGRALVRHAPRILYVQLAQLVLAAQQRRLGVWGRAFRDAARALPAVHRDRRAVQATRATTVSELERIVGAR